MCRLSPQQHFHLILSTGCKLEVSKYNPHLLDICSDCITFYHLGVGVHTSLNAPFCTPFAFLIAFPNVVRQPLLAESCLCQPSHSRRKWGSSLFHFHTKREELDACRPKIQDPPMQASPSLVGIDDFVSRLLSSVRFVEGGDEGKSPSTDSSIPTIVDTSNSSRSNRTRRISLWHIGIGS